MIWIIENSGWLIMMLFIAFCAILHLRVLRRCQAGGVMDKHYYCVERRSVVSGKLTGLCIGVQGDRFHRAVDICDALKFHDRISAERFRVASGVKFPTGMYEVTKHQEVNND